MKATLSISRANLRQLLRSIDRINSVPEEDVHADVHLKISDDMLHLYSYVDPVYVSHKIQDGDDITLDVEERGRMSFNIKIISEIIQKSDDGILQIELRDEEYRVKMPGGDSFSPVKFRLPRYTESEFREPAPINSLYNIDSLPREELRYGLRMMGVIDEFVNISLDEEENMLYISVKNVVNGEANVEKEAESAEIESMSQYYMLRPLEEFVNTINEVDDVGILVSENGNICLRSEIDSWISEIYLAQKSDPHIETHLTL